MQVTLLDNSADLERIMELCGGLDEGNPDQRDAKKYLTEYLLIKACAGYELQIKQMLLDRAGRSGDEDLQTFVVNSTRFYKYLALDNLQGNIVGKFGDKHKQEFARRLKGGNAGDAYGSIVGLRNAVAHGEKATLTYDEFRRHYKNAAKVLDELEAVLCLQSSEL